MKNQNTKLLARAFRFAAVLPLLLLLAGMALSVSPFRAQQATAATSSTVNFQARLMSNAGSIVADGTYNVEFKLYSALSSSGSSQGSCTGDAACLWTETRTSGSRVTVANGYLTVDLGSVTALPTNIDWSQELYLSMRVGGTALTPSWDPEMSPRLRLTAVPYAFTAGKLQGTAGSNSVKLEFASTFGQATTITLPDPGASTAVLCYQTATTCGFAASSGSGNYIQNRTSQQIANFNIASVNASSVAATVQAAGSATQPALVVRGGVTPASGGDLLQLQDSNGSVLSRFEASGDLLLGVSTADPGSKLEVSGPITSLLGAGTYRSYLNIASYNSALSSVTGTMKITLPQGWNSTMMRMTIKGYDFSSAGAWEVVVGGYNFNNVSPAWLNTTAEIRGPAPFTQVRLAYDGTNTVVLLGTTSTVWSYPKITISEFTTGHAGFSATWGSGWAMAPITSEAGITSIVTPSINMYTNTSGNIGIGTTSPGYKVDVAGDINISSSSAYRINGTAVCTSSGCTASSGSTNYIQNQNSVDQTANMRISGTARINTSVLTPLLDTATAVALDIGTTSATAINLKKATNVTGNLAVTGASNSWNLQASNGTVSSGIYNGTLGSFTGGVFGTTTAHPLGLTTNGATPQVVLLTSGNVGIGTINPGSKLEVSQSGVLQAGVSNLSLFGITGSGDAGGTSDLRALQFSATVNGSNNVSSVAGISGDTYNSLTSGTLSFQSAASANVRLTTAGNTTNGYGYRAIPILTSTGSLTNYRSFDARSPSVTGAGIITNSYGMYIEAQNVTGVTNGYGVYQAGANDFSYFAGNVGIGTSNPQDIFSISGALSASKSRLSILNSEGGKTVIQAGIPGVSNNGISFITANTDGTSETTRAVISSTGNFGIGTDNPSARLSVGSSSQFQVSSAGAVTAVGVNAGAALLQGSAGLTVTGAAVSLNAGSNFATNINTGSSTGTITLGGGSAPLVIDSTNFDVSSAGALSGITTITTSSTINLQTISSAASLTGTLQVAGDVTLQSAATVTGTFSANGNTTLGDANTDTLTVNAILQGATPLVFEGASADAHELSLAIAALSSDRTITFADEGGVVCLQGASTCGFAAGTASSYIQNQSASQQSASTFWISGNGRADTALQAPLLDTATSAALNIGTTNATSISLNKSTTVTGTLTVNGQTAGANAMFIQGVGSGTVPVAVIRGGASPGVSADVFQLQNANTDVLLGVDNNGDVTLARSLRINYAANTTNGFTMQGSGSGDFVSVDALNNRFWVGDLAGCTSYTSAGETRLCVNQEVTGSPGNAQTYTNNYSNMVVSTTSGRNYFNQDLRMNDTSVGIGNVLRGIRIDMSGTTNTAASLYGLLIGIPSTTSTSNYAGNFLQMQNGIIDVLNITNTGITAFRNTANVTNAFQVKNAANSAILNVDTSTSRVTAAANNTSVNALPMLVQQVGAGDSGIQLQNASASYYVGIDSSDSNKFKINTSSGGSVVMGYATKGEFTDSFDSNKMTATLFTASVTGTITSLYAFVDAVDTNASNNKGQMAIYTDAAGSPGTKIANSAADVTLTAHRWNTFPIPSASVTSGTNYWIVYNTNGSSSAFNNLRYGTGTANQTKAVSQTYGTWPTPWSGGSYVAKAFSVYAPIRTTTSVDNFTGSIFEMATTGAALFTNGVDSTNAFAVQNASGKSMFNIDTVLDRVTIGAAANGPSGAVTLVLDRKGSAGDPTGVPGAMYYNDTAGVFRCYEGTAWADCLSHHIIELTSDVSNNTTNMSNVTGLTFTAAAGRNYRIKATIAYTAVSTSIGSRWGLNGPATSSLAYMSRYTLTATTETVNYASAYDSPAAANASSLTTGNVASIEGVLTTTASGTIAVRFASEVGSSQITAQAGSTLEWW